MWSEMKPMEDNYAADAAGASADSRNVRRSHGCDGGRCARQTSRQLLTPQAAATRALASLSWRTYGDDWPCSWNARRGKDELCFRSPARHPVLGRLLHLASLVHHGGDELAVAEVWQLQSSWSRRCCARQCLQYTGSHPEYDQTRVTSAAAWRIPSACIRLSGPPATVPCGFPNPAATPWSLNSCSRAAISSLVCSLMGLHRRAGNSARHFGTPPRGMFLPRNTFSRNGSTSTAFPNRQQEMVTSNAPSNSSSWGKHDSNSWRSA